MILVGSQRGGATQLAVHLLKEENEHVEIHEVRGFVSEDVKEAFKESQALSMGTKCTQHLFSLSLNPPEDESVAVEVFEKAITDIEEKLGLKDQPRVIVFHEKQGRRHAHCVWSRIDTAQMKAINLPHYKNKLMEISKQLYLEHGWKLPDGLRNKELRNPLNYTREEWQQAQRVGIDPTELKSVFQECWNISDSRKAFTHALSEHGLTLAKGDRRGFVAVDYQGEVYAVSRWVGVKAKEVRAKLGEADSLPSVTEAKARIAAQIGPRLKSYISENEAGHKSRANAMEAKRQALAKYHRDERARLKDKQEQRQIQEMRQRAGRLRKGVLGLWDVLSGRAARIKAQNSMEVFWSDQRDRQEKQTLIDQQLAERRILQKQVRQMRLQHTKEITRLHRDIAFYLRLGREEQEQALKPKQPDQKLRRHLSPKL